MAIKAISVHRTLTSSTDIDGVIGNKQIQARILIYIYIYDYIICYCCKRTSSFIHGALTELLALLDKVLADYGIMAHMAFCAPGSPKKFS